MSFSQKETLEVDVYCACCLPNVYDEEMAQCDSCFEWYHKKRIAAQPTFFLMSQGHPTAMDVTVISPLQQQKADSHLKLNVR